MASPAYSITRKEIDGFWRRKETEEEERRFAVEKDAARTKAKTLKVRPAIDQLYFLSLSKEAQNHDHRSSQQKICYIFLL
jgi:hypothetical protein